MSYESICNQFRSHLGAYLDKELSQEEAERVRRHLSSCIGCALELEELKSMNAFIKAPIFDEPDEKQWEKQHRAIADAVNIHIGNPAEKPHIIKMPVSFRLRTAVGLAVAAAAVFFIINYIGKQDSGIITPPNPALEMNITGQNPPVAENIGTQKLKTDLKTQKVQSRQKLPEMSTQDYGKAFNIPIPEIDKELLLDVPPPTIGQEFVKAAAESTAKTENPLQNVSNVLKVSPPAVSQSITEPQKLNTGLSKGKGTGMEISASVNTPEFERYLKKQAEIALLEDSIAQLSEWKEFIKIAATKEVRDLVVYDLYQLYNRLAPRSPNPEFKKEAADFMVQYKNTLISFLGQKLYEERLQEMKRLH